MADAWSRHRPSSSRPRTYVRLFRARGVVLRIYIVDVERTLAAHLHHRRGLRGRGVVLLRSQIVVAAGLHLMGILGDGLVAHSDVKRSRDDRQILGQRVPVRRELVVRWER